VLPWANHDLAGAGSVRKYTAVALAMGQARYKLGNFHFIAFPFRKSDFERELVYT